MAYPQTTFGEVLNDYGLIAGVAMNATTGAREPTMADKAECADILNLVVRRLWSELTWPYQMLPSISTKATVTPTDGVIAWADIANSAKWSVWLTDPETSWTNGSTSAVPRRGNKGNTGVIVEGAATATSLVVFYQIAAPKFTQVAWVTGTAYVVGDVVLQGSNCYVCATAHTSGTFATDLAASKWTVQTIPVEMREIVQRMIAEHRSGDIQGKVAKTQQEKETAQDLIDTLFLRASSEGSPWYLHNAGFTR